MFLLEEESNFIYAIPGFEFYDINYEGIDSPDDIDYDKDNYYRGLKLKNLMIFLMLLSLL